MIHLSLPGGREFSPLEEVIGAFINRCSSRDAFSFFEGLDKGIESGTIVLHNADTLRPLSRSRLNEIDTAAAVISRNDCRVWAKSLGVQIHFDDEPDPIDRDEVMRVFKILPTHGDSDTFWKSRLNGRTKWLQVARVTNGRESVSGTWNPLLLARALLDHQKIYMFANQLDAAVRENWPHLMDAWEKQTRDHPKRKKQNPWAQLSGLG